MIKHGICRLHEGRTTDRVRAKGLCRLSQAGILTLLAMLVCPVHADTLDEFQVDGHLLGDPGGLRSDAAAHGVTFDLNVIGDYSIVLEGGNEQRSTAARYLPQASITVDTETAFGWPGGTFYIGYIGLHGENGAPESGDFQGYSNIDAEPFDALYSLWYQQNLLDDRVSVKLGKMDANADFAYVDNGGEFLNGSPGFSPTIQGFPSYPDPATAVNVFVYPGEGLYFGAGVYDGATQAGVRTGTRGPKTFFGEPSGLFWVGEAGIDYGDALPGRLGVGYWRHTGDFDRFDGGTDDHADGAYLVWDQTVYAATDSNRAVGVFAQYGHADDAVSEVDTHASAGVQVDALLPDRPDDKTGLMASYVGFSDAPQAGFSEDYELAIEAFHAIQTTDWLVIKPDFQYIVNPGGMGLGDERVATLRAEVSL